MRKNLGNDKVLRAITIGLSAMIAATSVPVTAFAEEPEQTKPDYDKAVIGSETVNAASETANVAREATDNAVAPASDVVEQIKEVKEGEAGTTEKDGKTVDLADAVKKAETIPVYDLNGNLVTPSPMNTNIADVVDDLAAIDANLTIVENYLKDENVSKISGTGYAEAFNANVNAYKAYVAVYGADGPAMEDANRATFEKLVEFMKKYNRDDSNGNTIVKPALEAVKDIVSETEANSQAETAYKDAVGEDGQGGHKKAAGDAQQSADGAVDFATSAVSETITKFDEYRDAINNAKTIAEANAAYDALVALLNATTTTLSDQETIYSDAESAYSDAVTKYNKSKTDLENAQSAYEEAKKIYDDAASKNTEFDAKHTQKGKDLEAYNTALANAKKEYEDALANLNIAEQQAENIKSAVEAAKAAVFTNDGSKIVDAIDVTTTSTSCKWSEEDALFESIIVNYYIPQVLEGVVTKKPTWTKTSLADNTTNPKVTNGSRHYCEVKYKDESGEEHTIYLDYVMANADGTVKKDADGAYTNGNSNSQIVIFEKDANEVKAAQLDKAANKTDKESYGGTGEKAILYDQISEDDLDRYKIINSDGTYEYITKEAFADLKDGKDETSDIVQIGGIYYRRDKSATSKLVYDPETMIISSDDSTVADTKTVVKVDGKITEGELEIEDGKVVKKYTADTTTITYRNTLATSGSSETTDKDGKKATVYTYTSAEAAQAALDAETAGKDVIKDKDGKIGRVVTSSYTETIEEKTTEYTASVDVYTEGFKQTIDLSNDNFKVKDDGKIDGLNGKIKDIKVDGVEYKAIYSKDDIVVSEVEVEKKDKKNADKTETIKMVTSVNVTYVKKSLVGDINKEEKVNGKKVKDMTLEEVKAAYETKGNKVVAHLDANGKDVHYHVVPATALSSDNGKVTYTATGATEDEAKANLATKLSNNNVSESSRKSEVSVTSEESTTYKDNVVTTYGYEYSYWKESSKKSDKSVVVGTDTFNNAQKVYGDIIQNQDGKTILIQATDNEFNDFIKEVRDLRTKYSELEKAAKEAEEKVKAAKEEVEKLGEEVNKTRTYKSGKNDKEVAKELHWLTVYKAVAGIDGNTDELESLVDFDSTSYQKYLEAVETLKSIKAAMADVEKELSKRIDQLTPRPEETTYPSAPSGGDTSTYVVPASVVDLSVAAPATGVAGVRVARANGAAGVVVANDNGASGVAGVRVEKPEEVTPETVEKVVATKTDKTETVALADEATPLAAVPVDEKNMNWWWLVVVAVLGATGYELYRKHEEKKQAAENISETLKKDN